MSLFRICGFFFGLLIGFFCRVFYFLLLLGKLFSHFDSLAFPDKKNLTVDKPKLSAPITFCQNNVTFIYRITRLQETNVTTLRTYIYSTGYSKHSCYGLIHVILRLKKAFFSTAFLPRITNTESNGSCNNFSGEKNTSFLSGYKTTEYVIEKQRKSGGTENRRDNTPATVYCAHM